MRARFSQIQSLRRALRLSSREQEQFMNWDAVAGNWRQFRGSVREKWGILTDNDFIIMAGRRDQLLGQIQACCGIKPEEAEKELKDWGVL
jgi:uncharacterized protein YjbJ (UPF0337 family)